MGALIGMFVLWCLIKKFAGWLNRYTIRTVLMWVFVFIPFVTLLFCLNVEWHESWARILTFFVLWLPLRWDNQMPPAKRQLSWAEKNDGRLRMLQS